MTNTTPSTVCEVWVPLPERSYRWVRLGGHLLPASDREVIPCGGAGTLVRVVIDTTVEAAVAKLIATVTRNRQAEARSRYAFN